MSLALAPGRAKKNLPGSHISDLTALRKVILLCPQCVGKFSKSMCHKYQYMREEMLCIADCDICRKPGLDVRMFLPAENWHVAHPYDNNHGRKGRWGLPSTMSTPTWVIDMAKAVFTKH